MRPRLQRVEREQRLLSKGDGDEDAWGFRRGARLIPWTRESDPEICETVGIRDAEILVFHFLG